MPHHLCSGRFLYHTASFWFVKLTCVVCSLSISACSTAATEKTPLPPELSVTAGLLLQMDVAGAMELEAGKGISRWNAAGSAQLVFEPPASDQRPMRVAVGESAVVRFDGQDDHLRVKATGLSLKSATIFLVAAPHANPGEFRGLFAANAPERKDYESGITIDLGPGPTLKLDQLNLEGRGFGGARDLLQSTFNFATLHTFEAIIDAAASSVRLVVDGKAEGSRPLQSADLSFEQLTLGARFLNHGPGPQRMHGPFQGDIAEVLIYDRVLTDAESRAVRDYLKSRHAKLAEQLPATVVHPERPGIELVKPQNPPAVQMLVPGFAVSELPVQLTNVNNVRYREDGRLVTLGYNGDLHLLSDTDGDGIEDTAEVFWKNTGSIRGPIGMQLTPPGYAKGRGVFVASKGKVSLIVDTNGDDKADEEIIVASGWNEIIQNVDALGPAMDSHGNIYFGLGVANFANAYQIGEDGIARYDILADNGTIQKVSADFSRRETVCTGIRFPVALAFNHHGDLFCTDQEGATWLANGNPQDELLHIPLHEDRPVPNPTGKRHFGFPPRHPQHNPGVIDEPSTFDFGPQHQSTCGMVFNEPVNGGPVFGPQWWQHSAIICGESRGKLWRTQTVKTPVGYVADSQLIGCLQMLTVDACVTPNGSLVAACHSGPPDWGTGPAGQGKLFKIHNIRPEAPRPVRTWAAGPQEIRITFDRPLDPLSMQGLSEHIEIQYGEHVRAGDRFENLVPPYAVVRAQLMQPRFQLATTGATLTSDLHTVIIHTDRMTTDAHYAVTLPGVRGRNEATPPAADSGPLSQHPQIDVDLSLRGIVGTWKADDDTIPGWSGVLPHLDLDVSLALGSAAPETQTLAAALKQPGRLTLETQLNLQDMLRPAIQPGAKIDYAWPPETVTVTVAGSHEIVLEAVMSQPAADGNPATDPNATELPVVCGISPEGLHTATLTTTPDISELIRIQLQMQTGEQRAELPRLAIWYHTNEDPAPRPLQLHRFVLPWIDPSATSDSLHIPLNADLAELQGGSWGRGRRVFRSEAAGCFKCHSVGDAEFAQRNAAAIGPDLRNLIHRDYASVLRDIMNPSFAINPDYIGHLVELADGRVLTGVLRTVGGELLLGDATGKTTVLNRDGIEGMHPAAVSVMPQGIVEKLPPDQLKDLLTYLLTPPPQMPLDSPLTAPPLRTQAEVAAALSGSSQQPPSLRPLKLVLVAGPKDHGPGEHDYPAWQQAWDELLTAADNVTVETAWEFPNEQQLASADVLLFFQKGSFADVRPEQLDAFLKRGGGAVYIHWAVNGNDQVHEFARRIGYASWGGRIGFRHGPLTLDIHNTDHPIVRNFDRLQLYDESYWKLTGTPDDVTLLATSVEEGMATPQMWVRDHQPGRVFVSIPGHYSWTFDDPLFRILLLRGIAWTAGESVDRFNDLVPLGARMMR